MGGVGRVLLVSGVVVVVVMFEDSVSATRVVVPLFELGKVFFGQFLVT